MAKLISKNNLLLTTERKVARIKPDISLEIEKPINYLQPPSFEIQKISKDYSFKQLDFDKESIKNPNIIETTKLKKNQNIKLSTSDKFDNIEDPFFDMDEKNSQVYSNENKIDNRKTKKINTKLRNKRIVKNSDLMMSRSTYG